MKVRNVDNFDHEITKALIKKLKLKQKDLATRLEMPYGTLTHILNGWRRPNEDVLLALADILRVPPSELQTKP